MNGKNVFRNGAPFVVEVEEPEEAGEEVVAGSLQARHRPM
jgi:hypothetical protein